MMYVAHELLVVNHKPAKDWHTLKGFENRFCERLTQ